MELEKLIEQFKQEQTEETADYREPDFNRFDAPIPGQSLTDEQLSEFNTLLENEIKGSFSNR